MISRIASDTSRLSSEILDEIPLSVIVNGKVLDLSTGNGHFVAEVERRKRAAGKTDDEIKQSVFGFEDTQMLINFIVNTHKLVGTYKLRNFKDILDMKFDVIVGNPPYQKADKSGRDDDNLWPKFLELAHELVKEGGYIGYVTPASWGSLGSNKEEPGSILRKKFFDPKQVMYVDFTVKQYFPEVASTFTSYVIRNLSTDPSVKTKFIFNDKTVYAYFNDYPCFPMNHSDALFSDIINDFAKKTPYDVVTDDPYPRKRGSMARKLELGEYTTEQDPAHMFRAYHTNAQTILWSNYRNSFHSQWKAVFSYSGTWNVEVTKDCSLTDASMCVLCNTEEEALSVKSVLSSEPITFLIDRVYRWSGYYSSVFINMIPALPTDKIYTDSDVYNLLFTPTQVAELQKFIKKSQLTNKKKRKTS